MVATAGGAALWIAAAVGYLVLEAIAAAGFTPGYSYAHNYISDLGVTGGKPFVSPRASLMHAAFCVQGVLFFCGAMLMVGMPDNRRARMFLATVGANTVGNLVIAAVHSGAVHVTGALLAIVGGNAAILTGPGAIRLVAHRRWYRTASKGIALVGFSSLIMLMLNSVTATAIPFPDGVSERGSVYSITSWQLFTATCLLTIGWRRRMKSRR
ncbi:hypothetical protein A5647_21125 [Mycobacterium sp. 1100029.7]|nr:hypothetical protein A5647_21125 [Mycobacterium sp. 1100029.7]